MDSIGCEEWKEEEELVYLEGKYPNRYRRDEQEKWLCPPAEEVATPLGFYFKVRSSREINWVLQRNLRFLAYYWRKNCPQVSEAAREEIFTLASPNPATSSNTSLTKIQRASSDDIYKVIADEHIYV